VRLLLDEHSEIAVDLRRRGHDIVAVTADPALRGLGDRALFDLASERSWSVITRDAADFLQLYGERVATRERSAGVLLSIGAPLSATRSRQAHSRACGRPRGRRRARRGVALARM